MCKFFGVSRSGYYAWAKRLVSEHQRHDERLKIKISEIHQGHRRCYGAERVHAELCHRSYGCSKRWANRLMWELGIKARTTGLYAWRPGQHTLYSSAGNQLKIAAKPNRKHPIWVGDFTYIKTGTGFIYFAAVMDLFSRKIVGWSFSSKRSAEFTKSALLMALQRGATSKGCLFHSDQEEEYAAHEYRDLVLQAGMLRSMSRRATPLDNAAMESFFHALKAELVQKRVFRDMIEAVAEIVEYVEFYNHHRLHSALSF